MTAAFLAEVKSLDGDGDGINLTVESRPSLVYGGVSGDFVRAANTERFLIGKKLNDPAAFQKAMEHLQDEVHPEPNLLATSVEYRSVRVAISHVTCFPYFLLTF